MGDNDDWFRLAEDAAAVAPEVGILSIFWLVRDANLSSGRNTTRPKNPASLLTPDPALQGLLTQISAKTGQSAAQVYSTASSMAAILGTDVLSAAQYLAPLVGL